ncbi:hypothetical protein NM208_g11839 [Fusarium decemcellulare]|uniref:Uncharacterized protein n=1 Tax=Fusarium decemcellulare TaxID=57161 RepID=A0ACC1RR17_9HYPO|nr:hypothetical protein NM208_g11839 [Fusarium decemcellulare]
MKLALILQATLGVMGSAENFTQPILWQDLADTDLIRVNETYYYSASNMHFSPGAPLLRSYDLVNWEYLSHSVPFYDVEDERFKLTNGNVYNGGVFASSIGFDQAAGLFYWLGCLQSDGKTYIYTATEATGPWELKSVIADYCYYDAGLLIDDDGKKYVAYSKWVPDGSQAKIRVASLTDDLQIESSKIVFESNADIMYIEGARFYKINGTYYIWLVHHNGFRGQMIIKSSGGPWGPYDQWRPVLENSGNPVAGAGNPHQGGIVETPDGDWWYIAFVERYPNGRLPVLAPLYWDEEGWPHVEFSAPNTWSSSYRYPLPKHELMPLRRTTEFPGPELEPQFEWNHNPDPTKFTVHNGLTLATATVTDDFFQARNTLSRRIVGPQSAALIELEYSDMQDGDKTGLAVFRYNAGWIGLSKVGDAVTLEMVANVLMDPTDGWKTTNRGEVVASVQVAPSGSIWLRVDSKADREPSLNDFSYSVDGGLSFVPLGTKHETLSGQIFFMGDRWGMFNFATKELGGQVRVKTFTIE